MSYNNLEVAPMFWSDHAGIFSNVYEHVWNSLAFIKDEQARVRAVNCYMVSFTEAIGMGMIGAVSMDEKLVKMDGFSSFAKVKSNPVPTTQTPVSNTPAGQKSLDGQPVTQDAVRKPYVSNGKPLEGGISEKQLSSLRKFSSGKGNEDLKAIVFGMMAQFGKKDLEDLDKEEASQMLDKCFAVINTKKQAKG